MYNQIILMYCIPLFSVLVITECGVMGTCNASSNYSNYNDQI